LKCHQFEQYRRGKAGFNSILEHVGPKMKIRHSNKQLQI